MNRQTPRSGTPTIVGLPFLEEPFPLTPYADVHVYTPSRERPKQEATPVYIPPARRYTPQEVEVRRVLRRSGAFMPKKRVWAPPTFWQSALICMVILYATLLILFAVF